MKTDKSQKIQAALIGTLTLLGVYTLLQIGGEKRTSYEKATKDHEKLLRSRGKSKTRIRNYRNSKSKVSTVKEQKLNDSRELENNFELILKRSLAKLPRIHHVRNLDHEEMVHGQSFIINAGRIVGRIAGQAKRDPSKRPSAISFLKSCLNEKNMYKPVRALCLDYLVEFKAKENFKFELAKVDPQVLKIYQFVQN